MSDLYGHDGEDDEIDNDSADRSVNNESLMETIETQRLDLCEAQCEIEQQRQQLSIAAVAGLALQERVQSLSEQLSLVIQEKIQVDQKAEELTKDIELKTTRERELTSKLQHALDQNLDLEENYSQLKSLMTEKTVTYQRDLDQKNLEIEELYNIIAKSETDYNAQLKKYQGDIQQLKQELLARQAHILHQQSILEQTERDLSAFRAVAASQNHNHKDADVQLAEMRVKCAVLREEKTILESQLSIARNVVSKALRLLVTSGYISEHSPITKSDDPDLDDVLFEMNAVEEKYKRDAVRATLAPRTHENLHHYDSHSATKAPDRISLSKHAQPEFHPDVTPIVQHRHQAEEVVAELISQDAKSDWDTAFEVAVESPKLQKSNQDRIRNRSQPSQSVTSLLWADRQSTSSMTEHESSNPSKMIDRNAPNSQSNIVNTPRESTVLSQEFQGTKLFTTTVFVSVLPRDTQSRPQGEIIVIQTSTFFSLVSKSFDRVVYRTPEDFTSLCLLLQKLVPSLRILDLRGVEQVSILCPFISSFLNDVANAADLECAESLRVFLTANYDSWIAYSSLHRVDSHQRHLSVEEYSKYLEANTLADFSALNSSTGDALISAQLVESKKQAFVEESSYQSLEKMILSDERTHLEAKVQSSSIADQQGTRALRDMDERIENTRKREAIANENLEILRIEHKALLDNLTQDPITQVLDMIENIRRFINDLSIRIHTSLSSKIQIVPSTSKLAMTLSKCQKSCEKRFPRIFELLGEIEHRLVPIVDEHMLLLVGEKERLCSVALQTTDTSFQRISAQYPVTKGDRAVAFAFKENLERRLKSFQVTTKMSFDNLRECLLEQVMTERIREDYVVLSDPKHKPEENITITKKPENTCDLVIRFCSDIKAVWTNEVSSASNARPRSASVWLSLRSSSPFRRFSTSTSPLKES